MEREVIHVDVLIVGGGPAGLAAGIHLADLSRAAGAQRHILLIEKGATIGAHSISGAVVNPSALRELLPDVPEKEIPFESPVTADRMVFLSARSAFALPFHPPYMGSQGCYVAALGRLTRWLAEIAESKGVQVYPGFSGHSLLYEGDRVVGVRTGDTGVDEHGKPRENYQPGTDVRARVTLLAEGSRGHLAKGLIRRLRLDQGRNPQVYAIGVKELWSMPERTLPAGEVIHTMGHPLSSRQFGGGFIYGYGNNQVALGLVVGLDYTDPAFDPHHAFQIYKRHPFVAKLLGEGRLIRYGAKTIPEGGLFAMPRLYAHGVMLLGDSAGLVSLPSMKGVHLAIQSGMLAAKTADEALAWGDTSGAALAGYETRFKDSPAHQDLRQVRNFRQGFKRNLFLGAMHFAAQLVTGGRGLSLSGRYAMEEDCDRLEVPSEVRRGFRERSRDQLVFDKKLTFDKATDIFYSGTKHDEYAPCHLLVPDREKCRAVCIPTYGGPCQHFCPAEVYEIATDPRTGEKDLKLHPGNCVHCKACDIKDPLRNIEWITPYGGDGPEYEAF
ncbi:MAG: electron transfer flavoprotein-ubiquinone oxidoreductase [Chromatiaceae bacterium]